jgi:hypothetical protein
MVIKFKIYKINQNTHKFYVHINWKKKKKHNITNEKVYIPIILNPACVAFCIFMNLWAVV